MASSPEKILEKLRASGPGNLTRSECETLLDQAPQLPVTGDAARNAAERNRWALERGFVERTLAIMDAEGRDKPETPAQRRKRLGVD